MLLSYIPNLELSISKCKGERVTWRSWHTIDYMQAFARRISAVSKSTKSGGSFVRWSLTLLALHLWHPSLDFGARLAFGTAPSRGSELFSGTVELRDIVIVFCFSIASYLLKSGVNASLAIYNDGDTVFELRIPEAS